MTRHDWWPLNGAAALLLSLAALSGCSVSTADTGSSATPTSVNPSPTEATPSESASSMSIGEAFQDALNRRDAEAVAAMAPDSSADTRDFIIGGSPYETIDCYVFDRNHQCHVVNGAADFVFDVDPASGLVTTIVYVGGD